MYRTPTDPIPEVCFKAVPISHSATLNNQQRLRDYEMRKRLAKYSAKFLINIYY